jgi:WD40 repeat protein
MMVSSGHRDHVFNQKCEYHHCCRILFDSPGQAQAIQRFCCIFARMEGDGFSTSSLLLLNEHVSQLLEQVILGMNGPLPEVPSSQSLKSIIFELLEFSCDFKPSSGSSKGIKEIVNIEGRPVINGDSYNPSRLRHSIIMTDFALHIRNKSVFLAALNSIQFVQARMVTGCVHWVVGNILQALRRVDLFDESEMSKVSLLFRSLISHKSRVPLLEIQPDLYFSIMSTIPSKELICRQTSDVLENSHVPWLRHSNKQQYFQAPIIDLADLPFAATAVSTSKRGHLVAAGDFSGKLAAWRVSSSDLLCIFASHSHAITGLAFSALDYIIISSSSDCSININSIYSSSVLTTISPFSQPAICLDVWLKNSDTFASVSRDGLAAIITVNLRSIAGRSSAWKAVKNNQRSEFTDEELGVLLLQPASSVFTFQVASFAVSAQNVHTNFVDCISCHPIDKVVFATGSRDTSIFVWKLDFVNCSSICTFQYLGHRHWVLSLDWMHVGYSILSSSKSSAVHVWRVPYEQHQLELPSSTQEPFIESLSNALQGKNTDHSTPSSTDNDSPKLFFVQSNRPSAVRESLCVTTASQETNDFSEFDGVRVFMEREEKEITQVSSAFKASDQSSGPGQYLR